MTWWVSVIIKCTCKMASFFYFPCLSVLQFQFYLTRKHVLNYFKWIVLVISLPATSHLCILIYGFWRLSFFEKYSFFAKFLEANLFSSFLSNNCMMFYRTIFLIWMDKKGIITFSKFQPLILKHNWQITKDITLRNMVRNIQFSMEKWLENVSPNILQIDFFKIYLLLLNV